jgi:nucleoside-diphosphate-sugar epimerase
MRIILTGASGFVGEGILLECLQNPQVTAVLMINRKPVDRSHPKLKELIVPDFFRLNDFANELQDYDACFYAAGISSVGMNEEKYTTITYDTTLAFTKALLQINRQIILCFVSGSHTDSSEKGKLMWARVKGKTENALTQLMGNQVYHFRPGGMIPTTGQRNAKPVYKFIIKAIALLSPKRVNKLEEVGRAMINAVFKGSQKQVLEIGDITELAKGGTDL